MHQHFFHTIYRDIRNECNQNFNNFQDVKTHVNQNHNGNNIRLNHFCCERENQEFFQEKNTFFKGSFKEKVILKVTAELNDEILYFLCLSIGKIPR